MTSSPIYDVITHVLMMSYDSIQVDMIQLTPFYEPAKFYLKWDIFELLRTTPPDPGGFSTAVYRVTTQSNVILVEGALT